MLGTSAVVSVSPGPIDLPRGMAWDGDSLWLADSARNLLYDLDSSFTSVQAYDTYTGFVRTMTSLGLPSLEEISGHLTMNQASRGSTTSPATSVSNRVYLSCSWQCLHPSTGPATKGLAYDGTDFWAVDDFYNRIYRIDPDDGTILFSCNTPERPQTDRL